MTVASQATDTGSIPVSRTTENRRPEGPAVFVYYFFSPERFIAPMRRDFLRAAVFGLMTPRFAALSIALYACGMSALASAREPWAMCFLTFFTTSVSSLFLRTLNTRLCSDDRWAFFAPLVIAIVLNAAHYTRDTEKAQRLCRCAFSFHYDSLM